MTRTSIRRWIAAGLLVVTLLSVAPPARAQIPVTDLAHIAQTIVHYIGRAIEILQKYQQIYNQYEQIRRQLEGLEYQLRALQKLDWNDPRSILTALTRIESILGDGGVLSHVKAHVRAGYSETFRGWEPAVNGWEEEKRAVEKSLKTLRAVVYAQHQQFRTAQEHIGVVEELKAEVQTIEGHEQALEVIAQLLAFQAEQSTLAQIAQQTSADATTVHHAYDINRRARFQASLQEALHQSATLPRPLSGRGGWGPLPEAPKRRRR